MNQWAQWQRCSDRELMNLPLRELGVPAANHPLFQRFHSLFREVRRHRLRLPSDFYVAGGFFVPDRSCSVALPFYLFDPRLRRIERREMGVVEGARFTEFDKLIRHELGHAVDNAFRLRAKKKRQRIFGLSSADYNWYFESQPYSRKFVRHLGDGYAQSHPDEDFAETFAVWLQGPSSWRARYAGTAALEKLEYMNDLMLEVRGMEPHCVGLSRYESIERDSQTLREYYDEKRHYHRQSLICRMDRRLRAVFVGGRFEANSIVREIEKHVVSRVADETGLYRYQVKQVVNDAVRRCRRLNLTTRAINRALKEDIVGLIARESRRYQRCGLYSKTR